MQSLIKWIRGYFDLSRSEANGFLVLMSIMLISILGLFYYKNSPKNVPIVNQASLDSLLAEIRKNASYDSSNYRRPTYRKYSESRVDQKRPQKRAKKPLTKTKYRKPLVPFDVNEADTSQLKRLRGVGSVLSRRIVKFRDVLGGYINKGQLAEVYGLQDSVLLHMDTLIFISNNFEPDRININEALERELSRHPYIDRSTAKALVSYRFQHGSFTSIRELSNIHLIDSLTLAKITPYISF